MYHNHSYESANFSQPVAAFDCVFSPFKDAEIDLTVLRVESEIAQEDFDKNAFLRYHRGTTLGGLIGTVRRIVFSYSMICVELVVPTMPFVGSPSLSNIAT